MNDKTFRIILAALAITPELLDKLAAMRRRYQAGEQVTDAELDELLEHVEARSAKIQAAG